jgi:hypothetical protein
MRKKSGVCSASSVFFFGNLQLWLPQKTGTDWMAFSPASRFESILNREWKMLHPLHEQREAGLCNNLRFPVIGGNRNASLSIGESQKAYRVNSLRLHVIARWLQ